MVALKLTERQVKQTCMMWLDLLVVQGKLVYLDRPSPKPGSSKEGMLHVRGGPDLVGMAHCADPLCVSKKSMLQHVYTFAIEYKATGGKPRQSQNEWRDQWLRIGGLYFVIDDLEVQKRLFREYHLPVVEEVS
jgi:hypothetical protein